MTILRAIPVPREELNEQAQARLCALYDWLHGDGRRLLSRTTLFHAGFCRRLVELGVPLDRSSLHLRQLHPQFSGRSLLWTAEAGGTVEIDRVYGTQQTAMFLESPVKPIYEGSAAIRRRVGRAGAPTDFPILKDLAERGFTDYVIHPLRYAAAQPNAVSFATCAPQGFDETDLAILAHALPGFAAAVELMETRRTARLLLETYLGPRTGSQVLAGEIRRGQGRVIDAVLLYADLAESTELSNRLPLDEMIALLNTFFDLTSEPIRRHGGEVLKFVGDAVLAIFPLDESYRQCHWANQCALAAAEEMLAAIAQADEARRAKGGKGRFRAGVALHVGRMMYGNIGAADRLDFTVVGPAVSLVTRLLPLARDQEPPLVLSADFAADLNMPLRPLGHFDLKGFETPQAAFGLYADAPHTGEPSR